MSDKSKIEWCDATWNPVTGCDKISAGCTFCYAELQAQRNQRMGSPNYRNGFRVTEHPHALDIPLRWKRPRRIFVCSMADLFHSGVSDLFIRQIFDVMQRASWHTFMVLTKRAQRLGRFGLELTWPPNVWAGVSVESRDWVERIGVLRKVPAAVKFVSAEPLLESLLPIDLAGIDQVIVGGESAWSSNRRPMNPDWARELRHECWRQGTAFFFKQLGGNPNDKGGELEQIPEDLRIRDWPADIERETGRNICHPGRPYTPELANHATGRWYHPQGTETYDGGDWARYECALCKCTWSSELAQ